MQDLVLTALGCLFSERLMLRAVSKSAVCGVAATSEVFVMLIQETKNVARCDSLWPHDVLVLALLTTLSIA